MFQGSRPGRHLIINNRFVLVVLNCEKFFPLEKKNCSWNLPLLISRGQWLWFISWYTIYERKMNTTINYRKESSQESRFVLVVVYYRGSPICLREGGAFTNQDPTLSLNPVPGSPVVTGRLSRAPWSAKRRHGRCWRCSELCLGWIGCTASVFTAESPNFWSHLRLTRKVTGAVERRTLCPSTPNSWRNPKAESGDRFPPLPTAFFCFPCFCGCHVSTRWDSMPEELL